MTAPEGPREPASLPTTGGPAVGGERRLDRPPSDRYRVDDAGGPGEPTGGGAGGSETDGVGSIGRGIGFGAAAAAVGALALVVCGVVLTLSAGLVVVAVAVGRAVGLLVNVGGGEALRPPARTVCAVALAVIGVAAGQLGLWLVARSEGGVLGLVDYLGQTFGPLVPLQVAAAVVVAWWTSR